MQIQQAKIHGKVPVGKGHLPHWPAPDRGLLFTFSQALCTAQLGTRFPPPQHNNVVHSSVPDPRWGEDRAKERGRRDDIHEDVCGGMGGTSLQRNLFVASASMVMGEEEQVHRSSRDTSVHAQSPGRDEPHPLQPEDHSPPRSPLLAACSPRPRGGSLGLSVSAEAASPRV